VAALRRLGLVNASDLDGGFAAWAVARLPVTRNRKRMTVTGATPTPATGTRRRHSRQR
jgi:3-mercaptopyruvate sulfurtransferase SseA